MALEQRVMPSQSLYLQNLPDKLQKEDLRRQLYMLFSIYGPILDITAMKTTRMRGQAHVLFRDVQAASQAMRACQGFEFFGKEMKIQYAKSRSKTLAKMSGVFDDPTKAEAAPAPSAFPSSATAGIAPAGQSGNAAASASRFPAPGVLPDRPPGLPAAPPGLPSIPNGVAAPPKGLAPPPVDSAPSPQGVKRQREDSDEEAPMDEDDDGEGEMDMSDDD